MEQDGDRLPDVRDQVRQRLFDDAYRYAGALLGERLARNGAHGWDIEALAAVIGSALVAYLRAQWTFGVAPLGVDEETFVATLVDLVMAAVDARRGAL